MRLSRCNSNFPFFLFGVLVQVFQLMQHGQVKVQEQRAASAEAAAAACARASLAATAQAAVHASSSPASTTTSFVAAADVDTTAQLQQRLDKVTRELCSERQRYEAAVSNSLQLQQRLDAALSMTSTSASLSMGFEALLPPSPPRWNVEPQAAAAASPVPSLHAQLSQVSVSAADVREMASAVAAASAAASCTETCTLERVNARAAAAAGSCSRMVGAMSCVLQRQQQLQLQLQANKVQLSIAQVMPCLQHTDYVVAIAPIVAPCTHTTPVLQHHTEPLTPTPHAAALETQQRGCNRVFHHAFAAHNLGVSACYPRLRHAGAPHRPVPSPVTCDRAAPPVCAQLTLGA